VRVATSHLQQRVVLVGHSGAGLLLHVIADALDVEVAGLVFVDSRLPPLADIVDGARRVLDDVVKEADDLHALVVSGVAQDVGDGLGVGEPLARSGPDALACGAGRAPRDHAPQHLRRAGGDDPLASCVAAGA
jgi:hypothetical protein